MNDSFNNQPNEIIMSEEERRSHKQSFSKICLAYLFYILIAEGVSIVVSLVLQKYYPALLESSNALLVLTSVIQYGIALPLLIYFLKKVPSKEPEKRKIAGKEIFKYFMIAIFIMYVGNYISTLVLSYISELIGRVPENAASDLLSETNPILSIIIAGILGPIVEEIMFRKLFTDRLTKYGDAIAILFPALIFGLFHTNLYQFFYAFLIGAAFSYIYVRTGNIIYSSVLHCFINLFCGVLPSYILSTFNYEEFLNLAIEGELTQELIMANLPSLALLGAYELAMFVMIFLGVFFLARGVKDITLEKGEIKFPKGTSLDVMLFNPGTVILVTVCIICMALNTFAVQV